MSIWYWITAKDVEENLILASSYPVSTEDSNQLEIIVTNKGLRHYKGTFIYCPRKWKNTAHKHKRKKSKRKIKMCHYSLGAVVISFESRHQGRNWVLLSFIFQERQIQNRCIIEMQTPPGVIFLWSCLADYKGLRLQGWQRPFSVVSFLLYWDPSLSLYLF